MIMGGSTPPRIFVTGTDTGVGKTVVSAVLTLGLDGRYWKPIQAGTAEPTDTEVVRGWTGLTADRFLPEVYRLREPMSPHAAAEEEGVEIDPEDIVRASLPPDRPIVIEGVGGLLVPLNARTLLVDVVERMGLPVLLVARAGLGTLNHTLLSLSELRRRGIEVAGVVLNGELHESNRSAIEHYGATRVLGQIPRLTPIDRKALLDAFRELDLAGVRAAIPRETTPGAVPARTDGPAPSGRETGHSHPNLWYPYTPIGGMATPLRVVSGRGARLELEDGRTLLDCISSWWVNLHGHANPRIADAIRAQAERLEHVIFAGFTHEPAERLAEALTRLLPPPLERVFYSDDGSTAVEVALKMAYQHGSNRGEARRTFLAFEGAYHGDTFGAMAVGARSLFTRAYTDLLFDVVHLPFADTWIGDDGVAEREGAALKRLESALASEPERYAALVVEPLVQGAGGMRMCRPDFLRGIEAIARRFGVLLIFDEVMTGFGRTGDWFACTRADVHPDIVCLAKGLTGGFLPMAATVASKEVYEAYVSSDPRKALWHGHSYTANPLGCAAALASLELLSEAEPVFRTMEDHHRRFLTGLEGTPAVRPRVTGTIAAFDLETGGETGYLSRVRNFVKHEALERGLLLRPLGNTVYLIPPYCLTDEERRQMYDSVREIASSVEAG